MKIKRNEGLKLKSGEGTYDQNKFVESVKKIRDSYYILTNLEIDKINKIASRL
jgi:hypothetical protein